MEGFDWMLPTPAELLLYVVLQQQQQHVWLRSLQGWTKSVMCLHAQVSSCATQELALDICLSSLLKHVSCLRFLAHTQGKRCLVSGSGNVAQYAAEKLLQLGAVVLTMSDSTGYIYEPNGFTMEQIQQVG